MKRIFCCFLIVIDLFLCNAQERGVSVSTPTGGGEVGEQYAFIIGVSKYPYIKPLSFADKDATLFKEFLMTKAGGGVKPENIIFMANEQATAGNFQPALTKFYKNPAYKKGDRVYFYFAGHGDGIKDLNEYYLLLYDCQPAGDANNYESGLGVIDVQKLKNRIGLMTKQGVEVYLILDACRTNELPGGYTSQTFSENVAEKKVGEIMMLATGPGQTSLESPTIGNGHGLFTYKLIDGLSGLADSEEGNNDGKISMAELQDWVRSNVRKAAQKLNAQQVPYFCCSDKENTTVAVVDAEFQKQWAAAKNGSGKEMAFAGSKLNGSRGAGDLKADTVLVGLYNHFNESLQAFKLLGNGSADHYYLKMDSLFHNSPLTLMARDRLSSGFIQRCQEKINLYLEGKDNRNDITIAQKEYAALGKGLGFMKEKSLQLQADYQTSFGEAAQMLEKTLLLQGMDSNLVSLLMPKVYFFYLKDYYQRSENTNAMRKDARIWCNKAWLADSTGAYISQAIALYHEKNGDYDSAVFYISNAMRLAPNWAYPKNHLGYLYYQQHKYDSAGKYFLGAIKSNRMYMEPYFNYGRLADEKPTKGVHNPYYLKFIPLPDSIDPNVLVRYAHLQAYPWKQPSAKWFAEKAARQFAKHEEYGLAAYHYYCADNKAKAKYYAKLSIEKVKGDTIGTERLAEIYLDEDKKDSALLVLNKLVKTYPNYGNGYLRLGTIYFREGKQSEAMICFSKYLQLYPSEPLAYEWMAYLHYLGGQLDSALAYSRLGLRCGEKKLMFYVNFANIYYDKNQKDSCGAYLDSAFAEMEHSKHSFVELEDQVLDKYSLLEQIALGKLFDIKALYLSDKGFYDSSITYARQGLGFGMPPGFVSVLYQRIGFDFLKLNKFDSAIANYTHSIRYDSTQSIAYYNLACIYSLQKNTDKALYYVRLALRRGEKISDMLSDTDLSNVVQTVGFQELLKKYKGKK